MPPPAFVDGQSAPLITCEYFTLEQLTADAHSIDLATRGESFHALTVIDGQAAIESAAGRIVLHRLETAIIPAACATYRIRALRRLKMLKAAVA